MTSAFESIKSGLNDAIKHASGRKTGVKRIHHPKQIDIKSLRKEIGMTQEEFAEKFCISLGTLRHWERGDRNPRGPTLILLHVIAKHPKAVLDSLYHDN